LSRSKGSAPLDFILVAVPMVLLTLSVIGIAMNGFAKNIAQDIAVDTARYAALADQDSSTASARAIRGLGLALGRIFEPSVRVGLEESSSKCSFIATVTIKPVGLGFLSNFATIRESARAVCELQG
jgi:hypothetical protein